jgi:hypothetical protein
MKMNFLKLYLGMFFKPQRTFRLVFESNDCLKYGFFAFLVPAVGYTIFYILANVAGGAPSTFKPWLALPIEDYFRYDIFLTLPGYYLSWIGAAGTVYLLSRLLNGHAIFDHVLAIVGFGIGIATWSSLFHDLTDAILSVVGVIDMREYERLLNESAFWHGMLMTLYAIYFFWFLTLFTIGIRIAQGFGIFKSIHIALFGLITFQGILLIFIR